MTEKNYITFEPEDIFEALEDLYFKHHQEKIDLHFDSDNKNRFMNEIRAVTFSIPIKSGKAELISSHPPRVIEYSENQTKSESVSPLYSALPRKTLATVYP